MKPFRSKTEISIARIFRDAADVGELDVFDAVDRGVGPDDAFDVAGAGLEHGARHQQSSTLRGVFFQQMMTTI